MFYRVITPKSTDHVTAVVVATLHGTQSGPVRILVMLLTISLIYSRHSALQQVGVCFHISKPIVLLYTYRPLLPGTSPMNKQSSDREIATVLSEGRANLLAKYIMVKRKFYTDNAECDLWTESIKSLFGTTRVCPCLQLFKGLIRESVAVWIVKACWSPRTQKAPEPASGEAQGGNRRHQKKRRPPHGPQTFRFDERFWLIPKHVCLKLHNYCITCPFKYDFPFHRWFRPLTSL